MRTKLFATVVAGLLVQAASASPLRLIIEEHLSAPADPSNVRLGHAVPSAFIQAFDKPASASPTPYFMPSIMPPPPVPDEGWKFWRKGRKGCMGRFSDAIRKAMRRPPIRPGEVHILPILDGPDGPMIPEDLGRPMRHHHGRPRPDDVHIFGEPVVHPTPANPGGRMHHHHHGHHRHAHGHWRPYYADGSFFQRLHFSLSALGPWEGRAVAFVLGCGIGVLLRMFWVLSVVAYRAFKGRREESDSGEYHHILFEQVDAEDIVVAPPVYVVDEKVPIPEEQKSDEETN